ncbi:Signal transduction histidine kinase [Halovenus aranensis]|uniref:histidine kinase n=1 Tax=Halovenus aranensis TaxID=890420 RepID=A0A1G8S3H0_9EURY|nr:Signal transduction histidine kinase [Halovenus aranensis]
MPGEDGIEFLKTVRAEYPDIPFILFTGKGSETIASEAISAGVTDYLQKESGPEQYTVLANRIANAVDRYDAQRKLEQLRERTRELMYTETVEETANCAVTAADNIIGAPLSGVNLANDAETRLEPVASAATVPELFDSLPVFERDASPGSTDALAWEVVDNGESVCIDSLPASDRLTEASPAESAILHPLGDRGLFVVSSPEKDAFSETDNRLVEVLANYLEVALDRVEREQTLRTRQRRLEMLHEATRKLVRADSEQEIAEHVVDAAENVLDFSIVSVRLYDEQAGGLVPTAMSAIVPEILPERTVFTPEGRNLNWVAFEAGEVRVYDDIEELKYAVDQDTGVRSLMHLPIGEFGTIAVGDTTPGVFDETDEFLARILATAAETALQDQQQKTKLQDRRDELARQNDQLDEFASVISHDLRNPLNVAGLQLELAQDECDSGHLDAVAQAHERMDVLIEDLLTMARQGEHIGEMEPVALGELVERCWRTVDTAAATIDTVDTARIQADRNRLQQLLENLVRNAVEHGGDDVTVSVGILEGRGFYIADDGAGIEESDRKTVFETGYSTSDEGTGFGLGIVKQVVVAHGWEIAVTESADGGARFEVTGVEFVTD